MNLNVFSKYNRKVRVQLQISDYDIMTCLYLALALGHRALSLDIRPRDDPRRPHHSGDAPRGKYLKQIWQKKFKLHSVLATETEFFIMTKRVIEFPLKLCFPFVSLWASYKQFPLNMTVL